MYQKSWWYDLSFLTYGVWQTEIGNYGSFFAHLLNLPPPLIKTKEIKILKNWKKLLGMHGYWNTEWGRQNFLSFWAMLCCFTSLTTQKIKILKKRKSIWICHHFTHVYQKSQCMLPELWSAINIICYHFEPFFASKKISTIDLKKKKIWKRMFKKPGDIILLLLCNRNKDHMMSGH